MATASAPPSSSPSPSVNGGRLSPGTLRTARSASGLNDTTLAASGSLSGYVITGSLTPATTCALVITRSGETTKPEPVMMRSHDSARPVILMTLPAAARTSGSRCSRLFGGSTATIGSASHGATTWGNPPESTTSPNARRTVDGETGIARSTSPRMLDSRTPGEAYGTAADEIASPHAHAATSRPATPRAAPPAASKRRAGRDDTFDRTHPPAHDNTPCPIEATP